jgi:hypothetical protein
MRRLRFARQICTALIPCLLYALPGTCLAHSGEFFKSTVTLENGVTITQFVNAATFPPPRRNAT